MGTRGYAHAIMIVILLCLIVFDEVVAVENGRACIVLGVAHQQLKQLK